MKLLYCPHCADIVRLFPERRSCRCAKSWGHYLADGSTTVQTWPSLSLGIANPDFSSAEKSFGDAPGVFSPLLTMRCWINPVSESDVTFVQGVPLDGEDESESSGAAEADRPPLEVLLIGGRAGVGKSTLGWEISARLQDAGVGHAFVEGDNLDQIHPAPAQDPSRSALTEANLTAMWRNYAALGCRRLIYANTVSVLEPDLIVRSMGGSVRVTSVLLTASDDTARARLGEREIGSRLAPHLERSARMAGHLQETAPPSVARVATDGRTVGELAQAVIELTGWQPIPGQAVAAVTAVTC